MNKVILIGNLTRDPELRTTTQGIEVCTFSIAVNRRRREGHEQESDFFRVTVWRKLAQNCQAYLTKGKKVCVTGSISVSVYEAKDGTTKASMEVSADEVEFLFSLGEKQEGEESGSHRSWRSGDVSSGPPRGMSYGPPSGGGDPSGYSQVDEDELPF
jgi:single-strand DNA-binding protein